MMTLVKNLYSLNKTNALTMAYRKILYYWIFNFVLVQDCTRSIRSAYLLSEARIKLSLRM